MNDRRCSAVIFDMDGLMVDSEQLAMEAWDYAGKRYGYTISRNLCLEMIGSNQERSELHLCAYFGEKFPIQKIVKEYQAFLHQSYENGGVKRKKGLLELLAYIDQKKLKKGIATSSNQSEAILKLKAINVWDRFEVIVTNDMVNQPKPAPDIYQKAARWLNVLPKHCIVLEDSFKGIEAAQQADMFAIHIPDIIKTPSNRVKPDLVLTNLLEVMPFIEQWERN